MAGRHPMENRWSRRQFLGRAAGGAIAVPSLAAILAACSKPGDRPGTATAPAPAPIPIATPGQPGRRCRSTATRSPPTRRSRRAHARRSTTGPTTSTRRCCRPSSRRSTASTIEITTFNNMEEGIQKVAAGQVEPDVFFPTTDYISAAGRRGTSCQPLQPRADPEHRRRRVAELSATRARTTTSDWHYTVPYTIYTTGVAYRRDRIDDDEAAAQGYDAAVEPGVRGRDQPLRLLPRHDRRWRSCATAVLDVNTGDPALIDAAKNSILEIDQRPRGPAARSTAPTRSCPTGEFTVAESWSGDIVGAQWYLPKGTSAPTCSASGIPTTSRR